MGRPDRELAQPARDGGGTTFHFVTDGIESALDQARATAGDQDVIAPVILGAGERQLENVGDPKLEPIDVVASPAATHVKYRVG